MVFVLGNLHPMNRNRYLKTWYLVTKKVKDIVPNKMDSSTSDVACLNSFDLKYWIIEAVHIQRDGFGGGKNQYAKTHSVGWIFRL